MLIPALRLLRRELAGGDLRLLLIALIIGVASLASVGFYVDRLEQALEDRKAEWQGGDLLITRSRPIPEAWLEIAAASGARADRSLSFRSVVTVGEAMNLSEVKAVGTNYPLFGALQLKPAYPDPRIEERGAPPDDEVWVEAMLLHKLSAKVGDTLRLGHAELRIGGVIHHEPDRGADFFNLAPRVLVNRGVMERSGLIQTGSRVSYRLALGGDEEAITSFRQRIEPLLGDGDRLITEPGERSQTGAALERAERFMRLASLIGFVLAGVAVGMSAHRYALRHMRISATYRCLGASSRWVLGLFVSQLVILGLVGALIGCGLGYLAQFVLERVLSGVLEASLPPFGGWTPVWQSLIAGLAVTLGFGFAPLFALRQVRPASVLRSDLPPPQLSRSLLYAPPLLLVGAMMWIQAGDANLAMAVIGGILATALFLLGGALILIHWVRRIDPSGSPSLRLAILGVTRRPAISALQVVAVGTGLMVLLLLSVVSRELLEGWERDVPADAPNHFAINIRGDQVQGIRKFFIERKLEPPVLYPMIRGRLIEIEGRKVSADDYSQPRAKRLVRREFNLSWAAEARTDNPIVAGEWWDESGQEPLWSVEEGIAETLGIGLGDRLVYDIAGQQVSGRVANLRRVRWDSFQANFFVVAVPGMLPESQATYITAFHMPPENEKTMVELVRAFPNLTDINVSAVLERVRGIIEQVTRSVEFISLFILAAGFLVLFAAVRTSLDERLREVAVLRVVGASRREIRDAVLLEFLLLGLTAGLLAALGAWLAGQWLASSVFQVELPLLSPLWLAGPVAGMIGMAIAGLSATRSVVNLSPLRLLREVS
jgi:putative ABC transport system permease protein